MFSNSPLKSLLGLAFVGYAAGLLVLTVWLAHNTFDAPKPEVKRPTKAAITHLYQAPPNFAAFTNVDEKKAAFYDYLLPGIRHHNQRLTETRQSLLAIKEKLDEGKSLKTSEQRLLEELQERYDTDDLSTLVRRVDRIPASLAIAQAATESGWGSSRFAQKGNNFYGQWCYKQGCGLVPSQRQEGASHEVRKFDTVADSIEAYFRNINTHPAYQPLRELREETRAQGEMLSGENLARGLIKYSERGEDYVNYIQSMIRNNDLDRFDPPPQLTTQ